MRTQRGSGLAVVTGAAGGIGLGLAEALHARGFALLLADTTANRQPAAASYRRDADGVHRAYGIVGFGNPDLFPAFGLPELLSPRCVAALSSMRHMALA